MATYIVSADSNPVIDDTPNPDKLIVTRTGLLDGVILETEGGWTVTINGSVQDTLDLLAFNTGESTITIGRTGFVQYDGTAVSLESAATLKNYGLIAGGGTGIDLSRAVRHVIINAGTIGGNDFSIHDGTGASGDQVTNLGMLNGDVDLGGGADQFFNSGRVFGFVFLGDGADFFKGSGRGLVIGNIGLGAGEDTFVGGASADKVVGGDGTDKVDLGGGNDTFFAEVTTPDGNETIKGGSGIDTYVESVAFVTSSIAINLDKVDHPGITANTAQGTAIGGTDHIVGFENATGGGGNDTIYGSAANNTLKGDSGTDYLLGLGGNDSLEGGDGTDNLAGGLGRDTLHGGAGADLFFFDTPAESGTKPTTRDVIEDFSRLDGDKIYLTNMDADTKTPGVNDDFNSTLVTSFTKQARQLRVQSMGADTLVEGDVNGDGHADFSILVKNVTLISTDFSL